MDDWLDELADAGDGDFVQVGFGMEQPDTPWLTPQETAAYLRISLRKLETLREDTPSGVPAPGRKLGRTIRWHRDEIGRWVDGLARVQARRRKR